MLAVRAPFRASHSAAARPVAPGADPGRAELRRRLPQETACRTENDCMRREGIEALRGF